MGLNTTSQYSSRREKKIVLREANVIRYLKKHCPDLDDEKFFLNQLSSERSDDISTSFFELYELPERKDRVGEFINKYNESISYEERLDLIKILLSHFSIHQAKVAPRYRAS